MTKTKIVEIPVSKAKYLAQEINETVHAGTEVARCLNTLISGYPIDADIIPIYYGPDNGDPVTNLIVDLFWFYDGVGMLSASE